MGLTWSAPDHWGSRDSSVSSSLGTKCVEVDVPFPVIPVALEGNRVARELQGERQDSEESRVHPTVLGGRNQKYQ